MAIKMATKWRKNGDKMAQKRRENGDKMEIKMAKKRWKKKTKKRQ